MNGARLEPALAPGIARLRPATPTAVLRVTRDGDWPRTTRVLPWLLAAFMAMLWLVPFDAVQLPGGGPVDLKLDRVVLIVLGTVWVLSLLAGGPGRPRWRSSPMNACVVVFVAASVFSVVHNWEILNIQGESALALKKLILLLSFVTLMFMVTTIVRPREVRPFIKLMVGLSCITAVGLIWQYRTGYNAFYGWTQKLMPAPIYVFPPPGSNPGRPTISGPTQHGIAVASMFAMALPYALLGMMRNTGGRRRMYALAVALLLAGSVSTQRKTGLVVPCAAMAVLTVYRPRDMLRLLPAGLVLVAVIQVTVPGAIVGVKAQLVPQNIHTTSTEGRTEDYDATHPDIVRYAAFGRGYGTYDPHKYRFLDNEYLHRLIEEGVVGTAAFIALLVTGMAICVRTARRLDPIRGAPAEASVAALAAFAISCAIYDALAYAQSGYMLFLVAGIAVCTSMEARQPNPSRTEVSDVRDRRTGPR